MKSLKLPDKCIYGNYPLFISFPLGIILYIIIIVSLTNIEKLSNCDCSKLAYKDYVKEWFVFLIFYLTVSLIIFSVSNFECWQLYMDYPPVFGVSLIIGLITLIMSIKLFLYLREIRKNCNCAYGNKEKFLYWFYLIFFILILSIIVISLIMLVLAAILYLMK